MIVMLMMTNNITRVNMMLSKVKNVKQIIKLINIPQIQNYLNKVAIWTAIIDPEPQSNQLHPKIEI